MPKTVLSVLLALTLSLSCVSFAFAQDGFTALTNADILTMVRAKLPPALIIEKINSSSCAFDTFPSVLAELKYKGVPDDVLMAMVKAPHGPRAVPRVVAIESSTLSKSAASTQSPSAGGPEFLLPEGTEFSVETVDEVSSKTASENDPVNLRVVDSVRVGDMVVIRAGTLVKGIIATVEQRGHLGKGGKLGMRVESTTIVDGQKVKLRASKGKGDTGTVGSTIVLSVLISPLFLLRRGNHAVIKPGTKIQVFTDEEKKVVIPAR
jgi:hypothetical protein